jgi:hypothetical protein
MYSDLKCLEEAFSAHGSGKRDREEAGTSWENVGKQKEALAGQVEDRPIIGH